MRRCWPCLLPGCKAPGPTAARCRHQKDLAALLARRRHQIEMLTAAVREDAREAAHAGQRHRLSKAAPALRPLGFKPISRTWLTQQVTTLDADLKTRIRQSPVWQEQTDLLQSVPGVGPVLSRTLIAELRKGAP